MVGKPWEQINNLTSPLLTSTTFSFSSVFIFSPALHPSLFFPFLSLYLCFCLSVYLGCLSLSLSDPSTPAMPHFLFRASGRMHTRLDAVGWMARLLVKPLVKQSATLAGLHASRKRKKNEREKQVKACKKVNCREVPVRSALSASWTERAHCSSETQ